MKNSKYLVLSLVFLVTLSLILAGCSGSPSSSSGGNSGNNSSDGGSDSNTSLYVEGQVLVRLKAGVSAQDVADENNLTLIKTFSIGKMNYALLEINGDATVENTAESVTAGGNVVFAEPNYIYSVEKVPDDEYYESNQYCHQVMNSESAWDKTTGSSSVIIAVADTGVNGTHEDLKGKVIAGYDTVNDTAIPASYNSDVYGHGTHVAGIAAGIGNNGIGIAGVNWKAKIMPVKVLSDSGSGSDEGIAQGVVWATDNGAHVINMSLGGKGAGQTIADAVNYAMQNEVIVVVSMGNSGNQQLFFPAAYQGSLPVGSSNARDEISSFSTSGKHISVAAPGDHILSTTVDGGYQTWSGTSMAAPQVTGLVALLRGQHSGWSAEQIRSQIEKTADDIEDDGFDIKSGWGRINVGDAITSGTQANKYGRIYVHVVDGATDLDGANVIIKNSAGKTIATALTDADGYSYFFYAPVGTSYTALANYSGLTLESTTFNVTAGNTTNVTIDYD